MAGSATFQEVRQTLHRWDKGSRAVREQMLRDFVEQCSDMTAPQLEQQFSECASLFLARVTSWMRITYLFGTCLQLQLRTITIFISASSNFLTEFLEVGGILTLLEIIALRTCKETDKAEAIKLLTAIITSGRQYKEMVCESFGVKIAGECLALSVDEDTQEVTQNLLYQLSIGNPRFQAQVYRTLITLLSASSPKAQQLSVYTLRQIQPSLPSVSPALVDPLLQLLKSMHVHVQHEADEFIKELLVHSDIQQSILTGLVGLLKPDDTGRAMLDATLGKPLPVYLQQSAAARIIHDVAQQDSSLADQLMKMKVVPHLLFSMSNTSHPDSQRRSSLALQVFVHQYPLARSQVEKVLGSELFSEFITTPEEVCSSLTLDHIDSLVKSLSSQLS